MFFNLITFEQFVGFLYTVFSLVLNQFTGEDVRVKIKIPPLPGILTPVVPFKIIQERRMGETNIRGLLIQFRILSCFRKRHEVSVNII